MKKLMILALQQLAHRQIAKFQPTIIAVTGSVGKTSTKNAIAIALAATKSVRTAKKNYNNEFGVPLAILGEYSPGRNVLGWMRLVLRQVIVGKFPDILVLEYGADKVGDIHASCTLAPPTIGVVTAISPVHVSNYPNFGALVEEKATLVEAVPEEGLVVLNADDVTVAGMRKKTNAPVATYGTAGNNAKIVDVYTRIVTSDDASNEIQSVATKASIVVDGETVNLVLPGVLGAPAVSACAAALVVAKYCDVPVKKAALALSKDYSSGPGRMRPLRGVRGSLILDDTYNAAPASVMAGLGMLSTFIALRPNDRRIAVLGTMAELGQYSEEEHTAVGRRVAEVADVFLAVGEEMKRAGEAAERAGMRSAAIVLCANAQEAGAWLSTNVRANDIVLVKGSQSARMEIAVKAILADPESAATELCRQEKYWLKNA